VDLREIIVLSILKCVDLEFSSNNTA